MTSGQLAEWMAYDAVEPSGEYRQELRSGQLCSLLANINRDSEKRPEPFVPLDFMFFTDRPEEKQEPPTAEELNAKLKQVFGK